MIPLNQLVPKAADFLSLPVEEVAEVLFVHLNSYPDGGSEVAQLRGVHPQGFFNMFERQSVYADYNDDVRRVLLEAWSWLETEGLIARDLTSNNAFFITRRGKSVKSREDFTAYRKSSLLPRHQVHPVIANKVYPSFQRGDYDVAVFLAFREVEVAVREAGRYPPDIIGDPLMRAAFSPAENNRPAGPLADTGLPAGEQRNMAHLFAGAFGLYRNSTGHRYVPTKPEEAAEVVMFASQLLRIVDRLRR